MLVAQSWIQEEEELKEGNRGQNRGVFSGRGGSFREALTGEGHLRERKGFHRNGRGCKRGEGLKGAQGYLRWWWLMKDLRAPCQCTQQSCSSWTPIQAGWHWPVVSEVGVSLSPYL